MIVRDGDASSNMYQGSVMPRDMSSHNELMQQQQRVSNNVPSRPMKKAGKLTAQVQPQVHQANQYSNYSQYANAGILLQENAKREHKLMHMQQQQDQHVNHASVCGSHSEKHSNHNIDHNNVFHSSSHHYTHRTPYEFLPLCDLLFNIISLAAYFCDVLFDMVRIFSIYSAILNNDPVVDNPAHRSMLPFMLILVIFSSIICQYLSLRWYARFWVTNSNSPCCDKSQDVRNSPKHYVSNSSSSSQQINLPVRCMDNANNSNCMTAVTRKIRSLYHSHMSQISSVNWSTPGNFAILLAHFFQLGILWRYFRLFVPVNLLTVKHEVRDLVMLRMVHGFCEAGPMLLMQVYLMWIKESPNDIRDLEVISTFLSLFAVCWALASFNKNARRKNIHKLILTWLGVIFQFIWRLGMISSRIIALTVCAVVFREFVLAVIFLHWVCMCLWILSPWYLVSHETEKVSKTRKFIESALLGYVYIFCFINWYDSDVRPKMFLFYFIIFIENTLLVSLSLSPLTGSWFYEISILLVWGGFAIGLLAMILYYKFFHIRFVKQSLGVVNMEYGGPVQHNDSFEAEGAVALNSQDKAINQSGRVSCTSLAASAAAMAGRTSVMALSSPPNRMDSGLSMPGVPGVFNCRLNPALKRKKKKPSTFPPPPTTTSPATRSLLAKHQSPVPFSDQPPTQQSSVMKVTNDSSMALAVSDSDNVNAPSDEAILNQAATGNIHVDGIRNFASFHRPIPAPRSRSALSPSFDTTTGQMTQRPMERREQQTLIERQLQLHQRRIRGSAPYLPTLHNDQPPSIMRLNRVPPIPTSKRPPIHFFRSAAASMEAQNRMNQRLASGGAMSVPTVPTVSSRYGVTGSKHHASGHYQYYHNPTARLHRQRMKYRSQTPEVHMMTTGRIGSRIYHDFPGYVISSPPPVVPVPGFFTPQVTSFKNQEEHDRTTTSSSCSSDDDATGCRSKRQHLYYEAEQFSDRHFHPLKFQTHHHRTHHYSKIKLSHASRIPPHLPAANETTQRTALTGIDQQTKPLNTEQLSTSLKTIASSQQPETVVQESHANQMPPSTLLPDVAAGTATADSKTSDTQASEVRPESSSELVNLSEPATTSVRSSVRALVSSFEENRKSLSGPVPGLESHRASLLVPSCKRSRKPIRIASLENETGLKNNSSSDADIDSDLNVEEQK